MEKKLSRRDGLVMAMSLGITSMITPTQAPAQGMETKRGRATKPTITEAPLMKEFSKDNEFENVITAEGIHSGKGKINVKFFPFSEATYPANFLIYDIPPGSSEGVHVHTHENKNEKGTFDEYYYIISGSGQMEIDGKIVEVKAGDHIHTPLYVEHGIENTSKDENMRVFLTFIWR